MHNLKKMIIPFILVIALVVSFVPVSAAEIDSPFDINITIKKVSAALEYTETTYTGMTGYKTPAVTVRYTDSTGKTGKVADDCYEVTYANNLNAGTATATIKMLPPYKGTMTENFTIKQATPKFITSKTLKAKALKKKAYTAKFISYINSTAKIKKVSGSAKLSVNGSGQITVKKGTKKGKYSIKVSVTGPNHVDTTKTITITVK